MMHCIRMTLMLGGLAGCTLTTTDVEPDLPNAPVYESNTVAYRLNGLPVVAHNYGSVIANVFGGNRTGPVYAHLQSDSTLTINAVDGQNYSGPGTQEHNLELQLPRFHGTGRYQPDFTRTILTTSVNDATGQAVAYSFRQLLAAQPPAEVIVTAWEATTHRLAGTFTMRFEAIGAAPDAEVRDGRFDLTLGF